MISIMVKGSVYTVGTPQYLSRRFGTDYKIDILLTDESNQSADACTQFMTRNVPNATLSIERPRTRIYSIPAKLMRLPDLFDVMEAGKQSPVNHISYYSCSSSSLEAVFMEMVRLSEGEGEEEGSPLPPKRRPHEITAV
jgi:hypothetical protein